MTTVASPPTTADAFARHAMIACAVVSPLALAVPLLLAPYDSTLEGEPYIRGMLAHLDAYTLWSWVGAFGALTLIPAIFAVAKVARSGRPALGMTGMILAFLLAMPFSLTSDDAIYAAARTGLDVPTTNKLVTHMSETPTAILGFTFFLALIGFVLLGVAALRSDAPKWAAVAMIVAPFLVPVAWIAQLGNVAAAVAWIVFAAASGGIASALPSPLSRPVEPSR
ncbi:MAG: hypothetical protein HOV97_17125 [Nonomuraea sp.]|nr:hypothetical protein [Nonomuraea sp.]NUS04268.1 hypothetical protein [Nonomuraea sp.]